MHKKRYGFSCSTPEAQGVPSEAIYSFMQEVIKQEIQMDGIIIMRNDNIIAEGYFEPFSANKHHRLFSAGKAVVALAILFAIDEGKLSENSKVIELLPDNLPHKISDNLDKLTLYHLLTMTAGHAEDSFSFMLSEGANREKAFFELDFKYEPGTHFLYDNGIPDILNLILHKVTGQSVVEYLTPRLFEPLGIKHFYCEKNGVLDELPTMCCTTSEFLKLATFLKNKGAWENTQLLNCTLVEDACRYHTPSLQSPTNSMVAHDSKYGYGYQIWRNSIGGFRLDGGRGQFGIVLQQENLVIAIHSSEEDQNVIPTLVWKYITNKLTSKPLCENPQEYHLLKACMSSLNQAPFNIKAQALTLNGKFGFNEKFLDISKIEIQQSGQEVCFKLYAKHCSQFSIEPFTGFKKIKSPFDFAKYTAFATRLNTVCNTNDDDAYVSCKIIAEHTVELCFKSDAYMDGIVLTISGVDDKLYVKVQTCTGKAIKSRSPEICSDVLKAMEKFHPHRLIGVKSANQ